MTGNAANDDRSVREALEIDAICLRFEKDCRTGEHRSIEQYLARSDRALHSKLLRELVLIELEWRRGEGDSATLEEYTARFPEHRQVIDEVFRVYVETIAATTSNVNSQLSASARTHHGRFLPGTKLAGRYRIVSLIGRGGMGEVYRADDLKLCQSVALKFLPKELAHDPRRLEYFLNEVRLARQVSHPNVCRVYDIGEVDGQQFLSMELIDGEDLRGLIRRIGRLPRDKGIQIAQQLCAGLAAAHDRGVLHRDLKPANIMIDGRGQARITDFGLARLTGETASAAERGGTPAYMAPEQLLKNETTVQSDLYALGLVLYEVFTGRPAHAARSIAELVQMHENSEPLVPPIHVDEMDASVEETILRCLEREPQRRPASARALAATLPGGDPLEAALWADEPPSPEIVAAGGAAGILSARVAMLCLLGTLLGLALAVFLADRTSATAFVPLKPPEVLADTARATLRDLGWLDPQHPPADTAYGFAYSPSFLMGSVETRPDALHFWYRQSPVPMAALRVGSLGRIDEQDPPPVVPGMANLQLDASGRLLQLICIPNTTLPESDVAASPAEKIVEWSSVLAGHTGLPLQEFTTIESNWTPPVFCDERVTWVPAGEPRAANNLKRVEAAFLGDRPVYVRVVFPWSNPGPLAPPQARGGVPLLIQYVVYYGLSVLAAAFAWHNVRQGRGDRRGAFRLAIFYLTMQWIGWLLQADHVLSSDEWRIFVYATGEAMFEAVRAWVVYLALEPFVRRLWPQSLVSWNRLMLGKLRDPLVGRHILIGLLLGFPCLFVLQVQGVVPGWLGLEVARPYWVFEVSLRGAASTTGAVLAIPMVAFNTVIAIFFSFFLLRWLLRTMQRAMIAFVALWTTLLTFFYPGHPVLSVLIAFPLPLCMALLLSRYGLLAAVAFMLTQYLQTNVPLTGDVSNWYFDQGMIGVVAFAALAAYAFHTSLGGQKLLQDPVLART